MAKERIKVESEDIDGKKATVYVKIPDSAINKKAQLAYNRAFRDALQSGAILRQKLDDILREQDVWNDEKQAQYEEIVKKISDNEKAINSGGIKLSEAAELAKEIREKREAFRGLVAERTVIDANTAEGQADNARFNFLVQCCIVDEGGKKVFESIEAYENSAAHPYAVEAAKVLAEKLYGLESDYESNLPENEFLKKYKFVDENLRLINKSGQLVDNDGRLINEDGRFVEYEDDGTVYYVDIEGNRVDEEGNAEIEFSPFLDDNGKPVPVPGEKAEAEEVEDKAKPAAKKPGRSKKQTTSKTE